VSNEQVSAVVSGTRRLRQALQQVADALAVPSVDALLESEGAIERAIAEMPSIAIVPPDERKQLARELEDARRALMRCRRLGIALTDVVRISFDAQGRGQAYGRRGASPIYDGRSVSTRV
jgi:hypothetical protein